MMMINRLSHKLVVLIIVTGLMPLSLYGIYALQSASTTSRQNVIQGNLRLAEQVAGRIDQYVENSLLILESLAEIAGRSGIDEAEEAKVLRQYSLSFGQFAYLRLYDTTGRCVLSSELVAPTVALDSHAGFQTASSGKQWQSEVFMTDDLVPAIEVALPVKALGKITRVLLLRLDLLHLWKLVDGIEVGKTGYLSLMTADGRYFASGDGATKILAMRMGKSPFLDELSRNHGRPFQWGNGDKTVLIVSTRTRTPRGWIITVEQPTAEAFAITREMTQRLIVTVAMFLVLVTTTGWLLTRRWIGGPVGALMHRVREIGAGKLSGSTGFGGADEFGSLATTIDEMANNLITAQEELLVKERQAVLGRVASGIVHDLKHPVESVGNYVRELDERYADAAFRKDAITTVTREFTRVENFLDNLKDLAKDISHHPVATPTAQIVDEALRTLKPRCEKSGVTITRDVRQDFTAQLDLFSFPRVLNNLLANAVEAMAGGGTLTVTLDVVSGNGTRRGRISVADTGSGIAPERLPNLFDALKTTKKSGLGMGLALARKIARLNGGDITVESRVGAGTRFVIEFPVEGDA